MTIALGIIARDGIVIAADREEGDGYLKTDRGKILQVFRGRNPVGWIAISGAGNGPALDEVARLLGDTFCEEEESTAGQAKDALTKVHRSYYEKTVLPFAPTERPDYELVIGCLRGGFGKSLFVTSKLAFNEANDYESVGIGASIANEWLRRLYDNMPLSGAIRLAAYVIYQVKNSVSGCGLGTDIIVLNRESLLDRVNPELIRKWEEAFRYYPSLERNIFSYCIGLEGSNELMRTRPDTESINKGIENLRKALKPLDAETSEPKP